MNTITPKQAEAVTSRQDQAAASRPATRSHDGPSVIVPDGTDTTNPRVKEKVEAHVRAAYGPHAVVMFPRYPDVMDGVDQVIPIVDAREGAVTVTLGADIRPTDWQRVAIAAEQRGMTMAEFDPFRRTAVFVPENVETRAIRDRIASLLKAQPHEVEVATHHVFDDRLGITRLDQVVVMRAPVVGTSIEKQRQTWNDLMLTMPGGSQGWEVIPNFGTGVVTLRYGQPRVLPELVSSVDLLPDDYDPAHWDLLPFGVTPEGKTAYIDFGLGPHVLCVGPSGTGKTIAMLQIAISALCAGHDLIICDVAKRGADYKRLKPWTAAWAKTNAEAAAVMKAVYAESQRRADIIDAYDEDHWSKLPPEVLERENIRPMVVMVDEYQAFNEIEKIPPGMDKQSPEYAEMTAINENKTAVVTAARRIVAEARWAGVYLVLGTQRAPSETIPVTMRDNMHWKIQLCAPGKAITPSTMGLTFPAEQASEAMEVKVELDDSKSRGLALMGGDGGSVIGIRVGYAEKPKIEGWLEERAVPFPVPLDVPTEEPAEKPGQVIPGSVRKGSKPVASLDLSNFPLEEPEPVVEDLGSVEFSLDDLVGDDGEDPFK